MDTRCDLIVVGAGIVGLATAVAAHDRGLQVRCLEAARPGAGQSAGRTRIFRHRHESLSGVELAVRARRAWSAWEARFGRTLIGDEGVLMLGRHLEAHAGRFEDAGVGYAELDSAGQRLALPALAPPGGPALLDRRGGAIRSHEAVVGLADVLGESLVAAEVLGVNPSDEGVEVESTEGIWRAPQAVLCAGARTAGLARPLGLDLPVTDGCVLRAAFAVRDGAGRQACLLDRREGGAYGSQCEGGPEYAVGLHSSEVGVCDGDAPIPAAESLAPALERTSRYVAEMLPGLDPEPLGLRLCRTTRLPWGDDSFAAWRVGPVTAFAGNNVFKFAPLVVPLLVESALAGEVASEMAPPPE